MGSVTMVIAIVGAYGAHKENRVCLIVVSADVGQGTKSRRPQKAADLAACFLPQFLVCMVIGSLITLRIGIPSAMIRPEVTTPTLQPFLPSRLFD